MSKAALVIGSAKRVGREFALHLAKQGYDIALHCNESVEDAKSVQQAIEALGQRAEIFPLDLSNTEQIESWFDGVHNAFPNLALLINNASVFQRIKFKDSDFALYNQNMQINAAAPIFLTQAFAKKVASGHVINMLDADITKTHGSNFFYLLSKKTLAEFTQMAARDLGPEIRVNGICIGSALPSNENPADYEEKLKARLPLKELGDVSDVIRGLDYLLAAPRVTGQLLFTDSGQHLL